MYKINYFIFGWGMKFYVVFEDKKIIPCLSGLFLPLKPRWMTLCIVIIQAIKMTGDNTPSHVIHAYKELLNMRRSHGEFDESFNLSECELATTKSINKDGFHFLQSIVNDWNHDLDDRHHMPQFGARQTT